MAKKTLASVITDILQAKGSPMSAAEVYSRQVGTAPGRRYVARRYGQKPYRLARMSLSRRCA